MRRENDYLNIFHYLCTFYDTHSIYMGQNLNQSPYFMPHQTNVYYSYTIKIYL